MATKKHKEPQREEAGGIGLRLLFAPFRVLRGHSPSAIVIAACLSVPSTVLAQGYSPAEAPGKMKLPEGFSAKLVASEPLIRQPVAIDFDDRGRLWVMQYLQYPNPAGLERVKVDRFSRTKYDKVPEPPPKGPKGEDRLTIIDLADSATNPKRERGSEGKDFLSGLNLASAFQFGHGGVYVLNPPYLLFYADRNRDDIPDGDPEVLLTGFGMDDAHSVANSLTWGPDGWLYGCQGSTVTSNIRGIEFQQGVWRYHPRLKEFELFCEGGGNSWGLDFDDDGNLLYSTNHGGFVMLHGVQGAYLWKQFGKHGELHNPHAYGYFDHVPHQNFFGGHVTVGGIVYRGEAYPEKLRGKYIAGDLLGHGVYWHDIEPRGTTFQTKHGGELIVANDTWFATSDVCLGPNGCVYVADWHDKRTAHPDPDADWDRRNGRVYRIEYAPTNPKRERGSDDTSPTRKRGTEETASQELPDLAKASSDDLLKLLFSKNHWLATRARRMLGEKRDANVFLPLEKIIAESKDEHDALKALWALDVSGGFSEPLGCELLDHKSPLIRRWVVRLLGDPKKVEPATAARLRKLAEEEVSPLVRSQLACTAIRLPMKDAMPIIRTLLARSDTGDEKDPYIPLLLWWALEHHCIAAELDLPDFLTEGPAAKNPIVQETILPRLVRRYVAEGSKDVDEALDEILTQVAKESLSALLAALELGIQQRPVRLKLLPRLVEFVKSQRKGRDASVVLRLLVRLRDQDALWQALDVILDPKSPEAERIALLNLFPVSSPGSVQNTAEKLLGRAEPERVRLAAISALTQVPERSGDVILLAAYPRLSDREKGAARVALLSNKPWAGVTLAEVIAGKLSAKDFSVDELRLVATHHTDFLDARVREIWGKVDPPTKEEVLADVRRLNNDLRAFPGDAKSGKELFTKHCANCHKLFSEGSTVGPDLTFANRTDRDFLLISTVDPSAVVRKEFQSHVARLKNGTVVTGLIVENKPPKMVFVDAKGQKTEVAHSDIDEIKESPTSLMPDNILKQLKPDELRDLFAYLQKP